MGATVKITCTDGSNTFALVPDGAINGGGPTVTFSTSGQTNQLWTVNLIENVSGEQFYTYMNNATGQFLAYTGDNSPCNMVPYTPANSSNCLWNPSSNQFGQVAIRPYNSMGDQNLNVFGSNNPSAGATVGTWQWGGGANNEVWIIIPQ